MCALMRFERKRDQHTHKKKRTRARSNFYARRVLSANTTVVVAFVHDYMCVRDFVFGVFRVSAKVLCCLLLLLRAFA